MAVHLPRSIHERMKWFNFLHTKWLFSEDQYHTQCIPIRSSKKSSSDQSLAVRRNMESHAVCGVCVASLPTTHHTSHFSLSGLAVQQSHGDDVSVAKAGVFRRLASLKCLIGFGINVGSISGIILDLAPRWCRPWMTRSVLVSRSCRAVSLTTHEVPSPPIWCQKMVTSFSISSSSPTTTVSSDSETRAQEDLCGIDSYPVTVSSEHVERNELGALLTKPTQNPKPKKMRMTTQNGETG